MLDLLFALVLWLLWPVRPPAPVVVENVAPDQRVGTRCAVAIGYADCVVPLNRARDAAQVAKVGGVRRSMPRLRVAGIMPGGVGVAEGGARFRVPNRGQKPQRKSKIGFVRWPAAGAGDPNRGAKRQGKSKIGFVWPPVAGAPRS